MVMCLSPKTSPGVFFCNGPSFSHALTPPLFLCFKWCFGLVVDSLLVSTFPFLLFSAFQVIAGCRMGGLCFDNQSAINMANGRVPTERSRHVDIQHFAIQDWKEAGDIIMSFVPGIVNPSDDLTKPLGWILHARHARRTMGHHWTYVLHVCCPAHMCYVHRIMTQYLYVQMMTFDFYDVYSTV